jgi:Flp pilus assembly protein TadG
VAQPRLPPPPTRPPPRAPAAVELAFVLPFLVIVLLGVWEVGRLIQIQQILNNACREGARLAAQGHIINANGAPTEINVNTGSPNVENTVRNYIRESGIDTTGLTVAFAYTTGTLTNTQPYQGVKGQRFKVSLTLPFANGRWTMLGLTSISTLNSSVEWVCLVDDPFTIDTNIPGW